MDQHEYLLWTDRIDRRDREITRLKKENEALWAENTKLKEQLSKLLRPTAAEILESVGTCQTEKWFSNRDKHTLTLSKRWHEFGGW